MALGVGMHPTAEAPRHPQQVLLVQGLVGAGQLSPPVPKPASLLPQREVAVEHDPIRAVVSSLQQLLVVVRKIIILIHPTIISDRAHGHRLLAPPGASLFFQAQAWGKRSVLDGPSSMGMSQVSCGKFGLRAPVVHGAGEKYSKIVGLWQAEMGQLNEVVHLWVYHDLRA